MDSNALRDFPCAVIVVDEALSPLAANREGISVFGVRAQSEDPGEVLADVKSAMEGEAELAQQLRRAMGEGGRPGRVTEFRWGRGDRIYQVRVGPAGEETGAIALFTDVTQQVRFEETRETARRYLEDILNNIQAGVVVMNRDMRITNMNRAQEEVLHRMEIWINWIEAIGMPIDELLTKDADLPWEEIRVQVLEKGETYTAPKRIYTTPDGDTILTLELTPLRDQQGEVIGAVQVTEDVTENVRLEEELQAAELVAERLEAIRETAVTVNHEINNPLMSILATAQTLLMAPKGLDAAIEKKLKRIETDVKRIAEVTKRLRTAEGLKSEEYIADGPRMIDIGEISEADEAGQG